MTGASFFQNLPNGRFSLSSGVVFSVGSTGDSPDGMVWAGKQGLLVGDARTPVPSGESPDGAGGSLRVARATIF